MSKWTETDIPDLTGRVIIVTGSNTGLGFASAKMIADKGATVVMGVRSIERGEKAADDIRKGNPRGTLEVMQIDLGDLESVHAFAEAFKQRFDRLDVLMNNAGVMATPKQTTSDGFEFQLGINHLGHFALTGLLLDVLKQTPSSRIVNVSSLAANSGQMYFDDLTLGDSYTPFGSYGQSKLANLLFTQGLKQRLEAANVDVMAVVAHPGGAATDLGRYMLPGLSFLLTPIFRVVAQSPRVGARSQVRVAVDSSIQAGDYYGPHRGFAGRAEPYKYPSQALRQEDIDRLWQVSEELTGVRYEF